METAATKMQNVKKMLKPIFNKTAGRIFLLTYVLSTTTSYADEILRDSTELQGVIVTGTWQETRQNSMSQTVTVLEREDISRHHRSNILPTLTEQVPGMFVTGRGMMGYGVSTGGAGGMMLRGISSSAGQVMVLVDGHPLYNGIYGHSIADVCQTMAAERVEVQRGSSSLFYGSNAMGGVVNIVTRNMDKEGSETEINAGAGSWGTVEGELVNRTKKGKFSGTVAANYGRSDNHRPEMGFRQYGGYMKLGYSFAPHWKVYSVANVTHFSASYPGTVSEPMEEADQWITRATAAVGAENHYGNTEGQIGFFGNFGRHKINDGYKVGVGTPQDRLFRSKDALMGVSLHQGMSMWGGAYLTLGCEYQNIYGDAWYTSRETGEVLQTQNKQSAEHRSHEVAGYATLRQSLFKWLTLDAGVRYDFHSQTGGEWIPQAGVVARPLRNAEIRLTAGKGFRNPTMREMYLYPPSNTDLMPERLWNYEISWRHSTEGRRFSYGVNLFYIDATNIIQTVKRKNVNTGEIKNKGVEVEMKYVANDHWTLNTNHSWLDMKHPVLSAPKYKGYLGATMHYGRCTAAAGLMQVASLYTSVGEHTAKEHFTLLNATVGVDVCREVELWVKGDNLLAQRYMTVEGMPMPRATFMAGVRVRLF